MPRPDLNRVPEYYHRYIEQLNGDDLVPALSQQANEFQKFLENIPTDKIDYRYAEDKWSIREVLQHIIDAERVFAYRALCFARKDQNSLPGFDEEDYARNAKADNRSWTEMLAEFRVVRQSTEILFSSFDNEQLETSGIANGKSVYVLAIGYILAGHANHHKRVLEERYLSK